MAAKRKQNTDSSKNVLLLGILIILAILMIVFFSQQTQDNQAQTLQSHAASPLVNTFMCQRGCSSDATCNFLGGDLSCINGYCVNPKCPATADCACNIPVIPVITGVPSTDINGNVNNGVAPTGAGASTIKCGVTSYQLYNMCRHTQKARSANYACIGSENLVEDGPCRTRAEWVIHLTSLCQQYCKK